jgi:beta-N-acetylhexosaminidase
MTAHVVYTAFDRVRPATTSPIVIGEVIRGRLGFDGVLLSDDLSMKALGGRFEDRSNDSLDAGCDIVLHCNGDMDEMAALARVARPLTDRALERLARGEARRRRPVPFDTDAAHARVEALLSVSVR